VTKEIKDIITAFKEANALGRRTALATVVHVEGSSYRRPGARMLVEDNGKMTGAISGGCLEGDALRKALLAINQNQNKLVTYDTLHEDDVDFGVQLGCNGIVHILFEPIDPQQPGNPIELLSKCVSKRKDAVIATMFSLKNYQGFQPGTCFFLDAENAYSRVDNEKLQRLIAEDAAIVLAKKSSILKQYADEELTAFVEIIQPPVSLVIVGAGNDALPMVEMATVLGWQVTMIDGRATHATGQRFPKAHEIIVGKPAESVKQISIDERTAFVLMTHNYNYDLAMLELLLAQKPIYIGALGPKQRLERILAQLQDQGVRITEEQVSMIYGPTGLDIGAEAAEEIALSILSEIKAVFANRRAGFLRERSDGIHARADLLVDTMRDPAQ
jgi:xanthine dehydrogenase accessory factor